MVISDAGQSLVDTFDRIVIINLAHRNDRRVEVSHQLSRLGLSFDHPSLLIYDACRFDDAAGFPTPGTRGCFHSHLGVWRDAIRRGDRSVLLLEDDFDFSSEIEMTLPSALAAAAEEPWSIFYGGVLEWTPAQAPAPPISMAQNDEAILGGHFIGMRGEALQAIVRYLEAMLERPAGSPDGGPMHVDGAYSWFRRKHPELHTVVAFPDLGHQRSSRTDIHELTWKDSLPVICDLTAMARRILRRFR